MFELPTTHTLDLDDEPTERLDVHREGGQTYGAFLEELVATDETGGAFLQGGYSE